MSVRITATGAVAFALFAWLTAPVSACDERYFKKCERATAVVVAADESVAAAKRKSAGRVHVVISRHSRQLRFAKRVRAPGFAIKPDAPLASAESRLSNPVPETALARRFRGFINPMPMAQNGFEPFRKPHIVALNLEPPAAVAPAEVAAADTPQAPAAPEPEPSFAPPQPPVMALASAESRPVTLGEPAMPAVVAQVEQPAPAVAQAFVTEAPRVKDPAPGHFPVHQLVIALCGALGAASALRFIVGV
jgi:hypothetical protein